MHDLDLGRLATLAFDLRDQIMPDKLVGQTARMNKQTYPFRFRADVPLDAIRHLRNAGINDDSLEAALLLVAVEPTTGFNPEVVAQVEGSMGGATMVGLKIIGGRPWSTLWSHQDELLRGLPEHRRGRAALHLGLMESAIQSWPPDDRRTRWAWGQSGWVLAVLARTPGKPSRALSVAIATRMSALPREPVDRV
jgi:hypothetical protein